MGQDDIAARIALAVGGDDLAHALASHHFADADRLGIGFPVVHPAAHVRVE
jgi:hypothetical protein